MLTEFTVRVGPGPLDRFQMLHLAKEKKGKPDEGVLLLLPPLSSSFSFYLQPDKAPAVASSIAGFFAERGYDVYVYNPRYIGIPGGACEGGVFDCSVMGGWDIQSMLDDIAFIRDQIEAFHPGTRITVGGFSLGGILTVAVANAAPDDYDGVIVWEGMLSSPDPSLQALNQGYCAALDAQLAAGIFFDSVVQNELEQTAASAELDPGGANLDPLFPLSLTNHQVLVLLLASPSAGPLYLPVPGFLELNGSLADNRFFSASEERLFKSLSHLNSYIPLALLRDISCALAGVDDQHVSNLGNYSGSVLAIGGGHGFGAFMADQLSLFGSPDVTFLFEPEFAHLDHFMTKHHREYIEHPIDRWIKHVVRP